MVSVHKPFPGLIDLDYFAPLEDIDNVLLTHNRITGLESIKDSTFVHDSGRPTSLLIETILEIFSKEPNAKYSFLELIIFDNKIVKTDFYFPLRRTFVSSLRERKKRTVGFPQITIPFGQIKKEIEEHKIRETKRTYCGIYFVEQGQYRPMLISWNVE